MRKKLWTVGMVMVAALAQAQTPMHDAAKKGDLETIKQLLKESPALARSNDVNGRTPVMLAAAAGRVEVVEYFLANGTPVTATTGDGQTLLHYAAGSGNLALAKILVEKYRAPVNAADGSKFTPVHMAVRLKDTAMLQYLLDQKGDPSAANSHGVTPVRLAVDRSNLAAVQLLIQRKADVNKAQMKGSPPLHQAVRKKDAEIVSALLKAGAKTNVKDEEGKTPAQIAREVGATDILMMIDPKAARRK